MSQIQSFEYPSRPLSHVTIDMHGLTEVICALIDSGADESLMDWGLAKQWGLQCTPLTQPLTARPLDGDHLFKITHVTELVNLMMSGGHHERVTLYLFDSAQNPLILGYPWLTLTLNGSLVRY